MAAPASGEQFEVDGFGWNYDEVTEIVKSVYTAHSFTHKMLAKKIVLGKRQVLIDGKTYPYSMPSPLGDGSRFDTGDSIVDVGNDGSTYYATVDKQYNGTMSSSSADLPLIAMRSTLSRWTPVIGLLTDKHDAPAERIVRFTGLLAVFAGDGAPLGKVFNNLGGGCPITLELNTSTGALTAPTVQCASADPSATNVSFTLPTLFIDHSRVGPLVGAQANISIAGLTVGDPGAETSFVFNAGKIEGALIGPGSAMLNIVGVGSTGMFTILGLRQ